MCKHGSCLGSVYKCMHTEHVIVLPLGWRMNSQKAATSAAFHCFGDSDCSLANMTFKLNYCMSITFVRQHKDQSYRRTGCGDNVASAMISGERRSNELFHHAHEDQGIIAQTP